MLEIKSGLQSAVVTRAISFQLQKN